MPCWISFSLAVPGFALRNCFRVVRDLCVVGGGGSIVRAVANIFPDPTSAFTVAPLVARKVERLVGIYVLAVHALDLSEIVAARSMLFLLRVGEGPLVVQLPLFPDPMSAFTGQRTLCAVRCNALLGLFFYSFLSSLRRLSSHRMSSSRVTLPPLRIARSLPSGYR